MFDTCAHVYTHTHALVRTRTHTHISETISKSWSACPHCPPVPNPGPLTPRSHCNEKPRVNQCSGYFCYLLYELENTTPPSPASGTCHSRLGTPTPSYCFLISAQSQTLTETQKVPAASVPRLIPSQCTHLPIGRQDLLLHMASFVGFLLQSVQSYLCLYDVLILPSLGLSNPAVSFPFLDANLNPWSGEPTHPWQSALKSPPYQHSLTHS